MAPADELIGIGSFAGDECSRRWAPVAQAAAPSSTAPGEARHPVYHQPDVRRLVANAARWAVSAG